MDRSTFQNMFAADSDRIFEYLSQRQYLEPHSSIATVLKRAQETEHVCPHAGEKAMQWLQLNENQLIGRLRRTELMQLARSIHRFWRQNIPVPDLTALDSPHPLA